MTSPKREGNSSEPDGAMQQGLTPGATLRQAPVIALGLVVALLFLPVSLQLFDAASSVLNRLFILDPFVAVSTPLDGLLAVLERGQIWRLVSPAFLHFSAIHIAFNAVLFLILGVGLEKRLGSVGLLLALLFWAAFSNVAQLLYSGTPYFGGLSGVVTAMFGARLVLGWLRPEDPDLRMDRGVIISLFVSLILFSTGVAGLLGVNVANTAHWAGLIAGAVVGGLLHLVLRPYNKQARNHRHHIDD